MELFVPANSTNLGNYLLNNSRNPLIQSMLSCPLGAVGNCIAQVKSLLDLNCRVIRVAIPDGSSLGQFYRLKCQLPASIFWIADVHFRPDLAMAALEIFEKVRINPGNFAVKRFSGKSYDENAARMESQTAAAAAKAFFQKAKTWRRSVRIGVNGGSLSPRMRWRYGQTAIALWESAAEFTQFALVEGFENLVYSFKSSNVVDGIAINRFAKEQCQKRRWNFPFHLGITEAGNGLEARIKSALGIGTLLGEGIGETLRISLSEPPFHEVRFARNLLRFLQDHPFPPWKIGKKNIPLAILSEIPQIDGKTFPPSNRCQIGEIPETDGEMLPLKLLHRVLSFKNLEQIDLLPGKTLELRRRILESILQACDWGNHHTEIIACPTCGRTRYDVAAIATEIRRRLGNFPGITIAVMGCIVNGVGEMGQADYGYIGGGSGKVNLYRQGKCVQSGLAENLAIDALEALLLADQSAAEDTKRLP